MIHPEISVVLALRNANGIPGRRDLVSASPALGRRNCSQNPKIRSFGALLLCFIGCATPAPNKFYSSRLTSYAVQATESENAANDIVEEIKNENDRVVSAVRLSGDRVETAERFANRLSGSNSQKNKVVKSTHAVVGSKTHKPPASQISKHNSAASDSASSNEQKGH